MAGSNGLSLLGGDCAGRFQACDVNIHNKASRDGINGDHHARIVSVAQQTAAHSLQGALGNQHSLANSKGRVRRSIAKLDASPYAVDFFRGNDGRKVPAAHQANHIRKSEDFHAISGIDMNEDVTGEKGHLQSHTPILPLAQRPITRKKIFDRAAGQALRGPLFLVDPDVQDKPIKKAEIKWQIAFGQGEELFSEGRPYRSGYSFALSLTG